MRKVVLAGAALGLALLGAGGAALSQDKAKIVSERQELMKQQGREMVAVRNWLQGKGDQAAALAALASLSKSVPTVPNYFPPGTGVGESPVKTRAKPDIWSEHAQFLAGDKTAVEQVAALDAAVKAGDKAKAETVFNEMKFCNTACHDKFRAPER
jgi:cytochrome c556